MVIVIGPELRRLEQRFQSDQSRAANGVSEREKWASVRSERAPKVVLASFFLPRAKPAGPGRVRRPA